MIAATHRASSVLRLSCAAPKVWLTHCKCTLHRRARHAGYRYSGTAAKALLPEAVTRALFIKGYTSSSSVYRASKVQWVTEMARHVRERFGADWGIAESGAVTQIGGRLAAAGAFTALAVCGPDGTVVTRLFDSPTPRDRLGNMLRYSTAQLQFLKEVIEDGGGADRVKARL